MTRLGDLCEFRYGKSLSAQNRREGPVPVYGSNGVVGWHDEAITNGKTIVIGRKGSIGEINLSANSCWPIDTTYYVDADSTDVDINWLSGALSGLRLSELNKAAAVPGLNRGDAYEKRLFVPRLDEQRRIAAILDKANALRQKRKRAIALLDGLIDSCVEETFATALPDRHLGDLFDVQGGLQLSGTRASKALQVPYLRVANVHRDRLELSEIKLMGVSETELQRTALQAGDILFVEGHGNADEIGRCAVWDGSIAPCSHQNHLIRARPMAVSPDSAVMSRWLNSPAGRTHLLRRGKTTSGLNTISVSDVRSTPVPSVPSEQAARLRKRLDQAFIQQRLVASAVIELDRVFASLQHRAFSGQL
jgi:type I restriction enzyme S subunit